jgi:glutathione S-transferase
VKTVDPKHKDGVKAVLKVLNDFLNGEDYFAGSKLTIADVSIVANISSFDVRFR